MGLEEFKTLPAMERRQRFGELSVSDQLAFVSHADYVELIIGGYPVEERILAEAVRPGFNGVAHDKALH